MNLWKELRRRKVVGVIPVYAAAAFALLELVDIIAEPLGLPEGTIKLVLIFLLLGLVITLIISWIYDFTSEGVKKTKPSSEIDEKAEPAESNKWKIATYVSIIIIIALVILNVTKSGKRAEDISKSEKTIAVLPFHYLSRDSTQVYFCDGIREEILNHLHKASPFIVRSRTSADHYRDTEKTSTVIGEELNVNYLVEGSVGCEENQLKIWIQLIDAKNDEHIWSEDFIREKKQVFSIQSEIARKIAEELRVILSPDEINRMESRPTENLQAYQAYLRGRYYVGQPHFTLQNWNLAVDNFQQAVEIDTGFALAYAELARSNARLYYLRHDLSESRLLKSDQAAAKALELGPEQPRVHLALGYYYLYAHRDHNSALQHLEIAEKGLPNNVEIIVGKAAIFEPLGRWEENINLLNKACELSPRDPSIPTDMALGLWFMRRYREAVDACNRAIEMDPEQTWPYLYKAFAIWSWKGPNQESRNVLTNIEVEHEWYLWSWYYQEVGEGNYESALQLMLDETVGWGVNHKVSVMPKELLSALTYDYLKKDKLANEHYKTSVKLLERKVKDIPNDPMLHSALGIAYAGIGQKADAIREGKRAMDLLPMAVNAVYGVTPVIDLATIYTMVGEPELAMDLLEYLLTVPSWISTTWIDWDIRFAPLKTHPRFQELISKFEIGQ